MNMLLPSLSLLFWLFSSLAELTTARVPPVKHRSYDVLLNGVPMKIGGQGKWNTRGGRNSLDIHLVIEKSPLTTPAGTTTSVSPTSPSASSSSGPNTPAVAPTTSPTTFSPTSPGNGGQGTTLATTSGTPSVKTTPSPATSGPTSQSMSSSSNPSSLPTTGPTTGSQGSTLRPTSGSPSAKSTISPVTSGPTKPTSGTPLVKSTSSPVTSGPTKPTSGSPSAKSTISPVTSGPTKPTSGTPSVKPTSSPVTSGPTSPSATTSSSPPTGSPTPRNQVDEATALEAHNKFRAVHNSPSMILNREMSDAAAAYAQEIAASGNLHHSPKSQRPGQGENLSMGCSTDKAQSVTEAVANWYNEVCNPGYEFGVDGNQRGTGHFTQVVWKESMELGIGRAEVTRDGMKCGYIVGRYKPVGNVIQGGNQYVRNVEKGSFDKIKYCATLKTVGLIGDKPQNRKVPALISKIYSRSGRAKLQKKKS